LYCIYVYSFPPPVGCLGIAADEEGISYILPASSINFSHFAIRETELITKAAFQLREFFSGIRSSFDLPLTPNGTPFQRRVWAVLLRIPYGNVISYKELALLSDCPHGFRAVGQAIHKNPLPFLIPCHRVISSDGSLGGYALGLELKSWLLDFEHSSVSS